MMGLRPGEPGGKQPENAMTRTESTVPAAPIILVTTGHPTLHQHPGRNGEPVHPRLGRLLQPRHLSSVELTAEAGIPWAADNDCFQGLDEVAFRKMLDRLEGLPGCLFVTVPDVVGDAEATMKSYREWAPELTRRGFPLGLVAQDGLTSRGDLGALTAAANITELLAQTLDGALSKAPIENREALAASIPFCTVKVNTR